MGAPCIFSEMSWDFLLVAVCKLGRVLPDLEPGLDRHTASVASNIIREGFFVVRQKYFE